MIHHLALAADWAAAQAAGEYRVSTRGATLDEVGFIHAAHARQVAGVAERYYADVTDDLVLLVIDPERVGAEVVEETPAGATEPFPHVRGPIPTGAVVDVVPVERTADGGFVLPTL